MAMLQIQHNEQWYNRRRYYRLRGGCVRHWSGGGGSGASQATCVVFFSILTTKRFAAVYTRVVRLRQRRITTICGQSHRKATYEAVVFDGNRLMFMCRMDVRID
jgi:hypothetical protein